jgi:hypothetical protein
MNMRIWRFTPAKLSFLLVALLFSTSGLKAQEIDLVGRVGWEQLGRGVFIYAERIDNNTTFTSGHLRMQVWATSEPYGGDSITGYPIGTFNLGRLPGGYSFANLGRTVRFLRPPAGIYYTSVTLEEQTPTGYVVVDSESFADPVNFGGWGEGFVENIAPNNDVSFAGNIWWQSANGRVQIHADEITNDRASGRTGVLRVRLWATTTPYNGGSVLQGYALATKRVGRLSAGYYIPNFSASTWFRPPAPGDYYVTLTLEEFTRGKWDIVDYITFPDLNLF